MVSHSVDCQNKRCDGECSRLYNKNAIEDLESLESQNKEKQNTCSKVTKEMLNKRHPKFEESLERGNSRYSNMLKSLANQISADTAELHSQIKKLEEERDQAKAEVKKIQELVSSNIMHVELKLANAENAILRKELSHQIDLVKSLDATSERGPVEEAVERVCQQAQQIVFYACKRTCQINGTYFYKISEDRYNNLRKVCETLDHMRDGRE